MLGLGPAMDCSLPVLRERCLIGPTGPSLELPRPIAAPAPLACGRARRVPRCSRSPLCGDALPTRAALFRRRQTFLIILHIRVSGIGLGRPPRLDLAHAFTFPAADCRVPRELRSGLFASGTGQSDVILRGFRRPHPDSFPHTRSGRKPGGSVWTIPRQLDETPSNHPARRKRRAFEPCFTPAVAWSLSGGLVVTRSDPATISFRQVEQFTSDLHAASPKKSWLFSGLTWRGARRNLKAAD